MVAQRSVPFQGEGRRRAAIRDAVLWRIHPAGTSLLHHTSVVAQPSDVLWHRLTVGLMSS
jgi:hypothetical protein